MINPLIFREYDIRGLVDKDLTDEGVQLIGQGFGTYIRRMGKKVLAVGGDCRLSTERFRKALIKGLVSTGCDIVDIGVCTSPLLYFSLFHLTVDGGVMITGSHNPADFNGFKLGVGKTTIYGEEIQKVREIIEKGDFASGNGSVSTSNCITPYQEHLKKQFSFKRTVRVAVDAGNGTAGEIILPILKALGVDVVPLNCTMDGRFPVHHPDPTVEKNLVQLIDAVRSQKLEGGIAFDGDGDRIGAVNEKGEVVWGDKLMIIYATEILKRIPGATFISEVKCSKSLYDNIEKKGGRAVMWKTGHSLIKAKMKEEHAAFAGEMSGHMFFADRYFGFDDAIYAALRLIEILAASHEPFSALLKDVPPSFVTPEIRIDCTDDKKFVLVETLKKELAREYKIIDVDGVRITFPDGWGLVRASNTQPVLVMRFEAETKTRLEEIRSFIEGKVNALLRS